MTTVITLDNVVLRAAEYQGFEIPSRTERSNMKVGGHAKLIFLEERDGTYYGERMWVKIVRVFPGGKYEGRLANDPVGISMQIEDPVIFGQEHVCSIERKGLIPSV
jgi:hypothetical protein